MNRFLNKFYKTDSSHFFAARSKKITPPESSDSVEVREITRDELIFYSKDPKYYQLSKASIEGVGENFSKHAFGTFVNNVLTGYNFHTTELVAPKDNCGGYPFRGIGLRLPSDVVYLYKGFALPEYRGQGHVGMAIAEGIEQLVSPNGWAVATVDIHNHSSIKLVEKLGLRKQHIFKEKYLLGKNFYSFPIEVQLGKRDEENSTRVTIYK